MNRRGCVDWITLEWAGKGESTRTRHEAFAGTNKRAAVRISIVGENNLCDHPPLFNNAT